MSQGHLTGFAGPDEPPAGGDQFVEPIRSRGKWFDFILKS